MSNELNRTTCLKNIYENLYKTCPSLQTSGRYIKSLYHHHAKLENEEEKLEYQYKIIDSMNNHIILLQVADMSVFNRSIRVNKIPIQQANFIKYLSTSEYAFNDGKYSLIDIETFKNLQMLKKSVLLKDSLVLPCKVKSPNGKYNFLTDIIVTKDNVLTYASYTFDEANNQKYINHNVVIHKLGAGIKNSITNNKNRR